MWFNRSEIDENNEMNTVQIEAGLMKRILPK